MLRHRLRSESGFSVVEGAVAGLLLVIGVLGGVGVFDSARRESNTGERLQLAQAKAEAELERMRDIPYAELATDPSEPWIPSEGEGDPVERVIADASPRFKVSNSASEELVLAAAGTGIKPYSPPDAVMNGGGQYEMAVYRFVSWRDVECQVADVSAVTGEYEALLDDIAAQLQGIAGPGGSLTRVLNVATALLPSPVRTILDGTLKPAITNLNNQIQALIGAVNSLDEIDPCDANIETLNDLNDSLDSLAPTLDALDAALAKYYTKGCVSVLGLPILCPPTSSSLFQAVNAQIQALQTNDYAADLEKLSQEIADLSAADHPYNTKRVTVAIVLDPVAGSGPFKPVWATSIVSDPEAGVLGG